MKILKDERERERERERENPATVKDFASQHE